jgi:hypothetical protein
MKVCEGVDVSSRDKWLASCPSRFTPGEIAPQYPLYRLLGGPQSQSGCQDPKTLTMQPTACCYNDWAIPTSYKNRNQKFSIFLAVISCVLTMKTLKTKLQYLILSIRIYTELQKKNIT